MSLERKLLFTLITSNHQIILWRLQTICILHIRVSAHDTCLIWLVLTPHLAPPSTSKWRSPWWANALAGQRPLQLSQHFSMVGFNGFFCRTKMIHLWAKKKIKSSLIQSKISFASFSVDISKSIASLFNKTSKSDATAKNKYLSQLHHCDSTSSVSETIFCKYLLGLNTVFWWWDKNWLGKHEEQTQPEPKSFFSPTSKGRTINTSKQTKLLKTEKLTVI